MDTITLIGLAAASFTVLGVLAAAARRMRSGWAAVNARLGSLEAALRVHKTARLRRGLYLSVPSAPGGVLWVESGTKCLIRSVDHGVAEVRLHGGLVDAELPMTELETSET